MSRRASRGGRPRHLDHRGGPRPHDPTRNGRPLTPAAPESSPPPPDARRPDPAGAGVPEQIGVDDVGREAVAASIAVATDAPELMAGATAPTRDGDAHDTEGAASGMGSAAAPGTGPIAAAVTAPIVSAQLDGGHQPAHVDRQGGCTTAQLRRFIKSRAYIPIHEIRRRFLITTEDDDVSGIDLETGRVFVGLPPREGQMLGELLRGGEVGYELQLDPVAPVVVGVYPMRPVSRS